MEAAIGFEPMHGGFADLSLNHLGTPPQSRPQSRLDPFNYHAWGSASIDHPHAAMQRMDHDIKWGREDHHAKGGAYFGTAHGQK